MSRPADERPPDGLDPSVAARLRAALDRAPADDAALPSPEALHDAVAGRLPPEERARVLDAALRTPAGRREVALLRTALRAAAEAWPDGGA